MWNYNGEDDTSRYGRKGPDDFAALATMLANLYKGEKEEFPCLKCRDGFSMYNPPSWVNFQSRILFNPYLKPQLVGLKLTIFNRNGGRPPRGSIALLRSQRIIFGT